MYFIVMNGLNCNKNENLTYFQRIIAESPLCPEFLYEFPQFPYF